MKIFFEEYKYPKNVVKPYIHDHYLTFLNDDRVHISYVGYYFFKDIETGETDSVFILPKVFINITPDKEEKAFGIFRPEEIIDTANKNNPLLKTQYFAEIFNLSTWIYRAIAQYKERNHPENITEVVPVQNVQSVHGENSETFIDIILRLIRFNNEHRHLFTYIARVNSQGQHKINWQKTISRVSPILQEESPIYMRFLNKSKTINFDEELLVLFYSVLDYLHLKYNFKIIRNVNYPTDSREVERLIASEKGTRLLRTIRRKYFKDELVELWQLLYVFFQKAENVASKRTHEEALLVKDFNRVFEDMVDALISDNTKRTHKELKDQPDGKIVDHIYRYESLTQPDDIYYIGDSKYYKEGHDPGENSIFKQFTYAKNVIQMNMDLFGEKLKKGDLGRHHYFDDLTEGYNISPNFFIRGVVNPKHINYTEDELDTEKEEDGTVKVERRQHHDNRLFDRDTLFIQKYSINFLFVLSAYASTSIDTDFKRHIHMIFRDNLVSWFADNYRFFVIRPFKGSLKENIDKHFRVLLGKVYSYGNDKAILSIDARNEASMYDIYHAIHVDFDIFNYDIVEAKEKSVFTPPKLANVEDDQDVRNLIYNHIVFMQAPDSQLQIEVTATFQTKYWGMTSRDWLRIIGEYTPLVRQAAKEKEVKAQEIPLRYGMAADDLSSTIDLD